MASKNNLNHTPWRLSLVVLGGTLSFGIILAVPAYLNSSWTGAARVMVHSMFYGAAYLGLCAFVFPALRAKTSLRLRIRQSLVAVLTMTVVAFTLVNFTLYWDSGVWMLSRGSDGSFVAPRSWVYFALPIIPLSGLAVTQFNQSWAPMKALELRARRADELAATAQLQALRAQINPHFLFNSLNSIAQLIVSDPVQAEACVQRLAEIYRYLLSSDDRAFVPLSDELEITDGYLDIERARFGSQLRVDMEISEAARQAIVPILVLQPLVENAVRHGVSKKISGGTVSIRARVADRQLILNVEDTGVGMNPDRSHGNSQGIGLRSVRERLTHLYGDGFVPEVWSQPGEGTRIELRLPIVPPDSPIQAS